MLLSIGIVVIRVVLSTPILGWLIEGCIYAGIVVEDIVQVVTFDGRLDVWSYCTWHIWILLVLSQLESWMLISPKTACTEIVEDAPERVSR